MSTCGLQLNVHNIQKNAISYSVNNVFRTTLYDKFNKRQKLYYDSTYFLNLALKSL